VTDALQLDDLRIFTEPQQGASSDDLLAVALRVEELGFGAFFRSDHDLAMGDGDGLPGPTDAWLTLAGLAQVDQMSAGRVDLCGRVRATCEAIDGPRRSRSSQPDRRRRRNAAELNRSESRNP
jgi:hypothetical protein